MFVQIVLDSPHTVFTNLDYIRGKVILGLPSTTPIASIVVKLEGESRTRLMSPGRPDIGERPHAREELHKILYRVEPVLAPGKADTADNPLGGSRYYYLQPGQHEYPFQFKIPFNNVCYNAPPTTELALPGIRLQVAKPALRHVKTTLPPTVTAFPGLADIRYFLKVTVNRKEFYKENPRVIQLFNFLPIEPPRAPPSSSESYARRQHDFPSVPPTQATPSDSKGKSLFSRKSSSSAPIVSSNPPSITIDARLPNPAILTCNQDVPLRLLIRRLNDSTDPLFLQSLHIELIGHTHVRAQEVFRDETNSWVVASHSNMNKLLELTPSTNGKQSSEASKEFSIDAAAWQDKPLPNTVAPTFQTCNMSRKYELLIRVGISYGTNLAKNTVVLPLQMPVTVYSGIKPPSELLAAMSAGQNTVNKKPLSAQAQLNVATAQSSSSSQSDPSVPPAQPPRPQFAPMPPGEEEPPPSYEDAIALDMPPADGPRNYQPPAIGPNNGGFPEEKGRRSS